MIDMNDVPLAIIIPAFKLKYFSKTLQSIANQTNKNFNLYIGDDNSPADLTPIVDQYQNRINIKYTKFSNNIGAKNLVHQWQRSIELSNEEPWIWLFSDDDIMEPNCVDNFYKTLTEKKNRFNVYRFNVNVIDDNDNIIQTNPEGPEEESSEQMAYYLLNGKRSNSMPDHVFSRKIYNETGGLVFTDYAQGADWATSILFSAKKGICVIKNSHVYWRYSGNNISSTAFQNKNEKILGHLQFIKWILANFEYLKTGESAISYEQMARAAKDNLTAVVVNHYKGIKLNFLLPMFQFYRDELGLSWPNSIIEILKIHENMIPIISILRNIIGT